MINVVLIAVIAALIAAAVLVSRKRVSRGCCEPSQDSVQEVWVTDTDPAHYPYTRTVQIEGMHCENCVRRVANAYNQMEGCWAQVSLSKKRALVRTKQPVRDEELIAVPARLGYTAKIGG